MAGINRGEYCERRRRGQHREQDPNFLVSSVDRENDTASERRACCPLTSVVGVPISCLPAPNYCRTSKILWQTAGRCIWRVSLCASNGISLRNKTRVIINKLKLPAINLNTTNENPSIIRVGIR